MKFTAITESHLYGKVYKNGARKSSAALSVCVLRDKRAGLLKSQHPEKKQINRIGISASKKIGGAVQRNRAKRVVREAWRQIERENGIKTGWLVVLTPYPCAAKVKMQDVKRDLYNCLSKLHMLAGDPESPSANRKNNPHPQKRN